MCGRPFAHPSVRTCQSACKTYACVDTCFVCIHALINRKWINKLFGLFKLYRVKASGELSASPYLELKADFDIFGVEFRCHIGVHNLLFIVFCLLPVRNLLFIVFCLLIHLCIYYLLIVSLYG